MTRPPLGRTSAHGRKWFRNGAILWVPQLVGFGCRDQESRIMRVANVEEKESFLHTNEIFAIPGSVFTPMSNNYDY